MNYFRTQEAFKQSRRAAVWCHFEGATWTVFQIGQNGDFLTLFREGCNQRIRDSDRIEFVMLEFGEFIGVAAEVFQDVADSILFAFKRLVVERPDSCHATAEGFPTAHRCHAKVARVCAGRQSADKKMKMRTASQLALFLSKHPLRFFLLPVVLLLAQPLVKHRITDRHGWNAATHYFELLALLQ